MRPNPCYHHTMVFIGAVGAERGLKAVAIYEAIKGVIAIGLAYAFQTLARGEIRAASEALIARAGFDPLSVEFAGPLGFLDTVDQVDPSKVMLAAGAYAMLRFTLTWGLWCKRTWAQWLAMLSIGLFVPYEIYEFVRSQSWIAFTLALVNSAALAFVALGFLRQRALARDPKTSQA